MPRSALLCLIPLLGCVVLHTAVAADEFFEITTLPSTDRTVAAELADFDGDGRADLFVGVLRGLPPNDQRLARVYLQGPDGRFPSVPSFVKQLPNWSGVYDLADIRSDNPGTELIVLVPDGVVIISLASESAPSWKLEVPGPTTMGPAADERGLDTFRIVYRHLGEEPWLLVPQVGQLTALSPDGQVRATLSLPRRANYFIIPPTGLLALETDLQIFLDSPKMLFGDINGDGRNDIASATRHEIWVFLQRADGSFEFEPDRKLALNMVTPRDHIRGSGGVAIDAGYINGDGKLDLLISHVSGGFGDATTQIHVYLNHDGQWNIGAPDQTITQKGSISSNALYDVDRDGEMELLRLQFSFSLLELIELMLSREIDLELSIYRHTGAGFETDPLVKRQISLPISFDTFRTKGFVPSARVDLNGDGYVDFISSGSGDKIEFYAGGRDGPFRVKPARQKMRTAGMIGFGDWSGDGLLDFVIFDPHSYDVPVRLGRNLGRLPGTPAAIRSDEP